MARIVVGPNGAARRVKRPFDRWRDRIVGALALGSIAWAVARIIGMI